MQPTMTTHIVLGGSRQEPHCEYASSNGEAKICKDACMVLHSRPPATASSNRKLLQLARLWGRLFGRFSLHDASTVSVFLVYDNVAYSVIRFGVRCTRQIFPESLLWYILAIGGPHRNLVVVAAWRSKHISLRSRESSMLNLELERGRPGKKTM